MTSEPPAPRPAYPPPLGMFLSVSASIFTSFPRRSIAQDATRLLNSHHPRPILTGIEHIPKEGPFLIAANHHHRKDLWIGWCGALVEEAVNSVRPARHPVRIVVNNLQRAKFRGREFVIPFSRWFFGRVIRIWEQIPISGERNDASGHAAALRTTLGVLKQGLPVLFFPEGEWGSTYSLVEALPGTGTFLALASRRAPVLPVAFWEDGDLLRGQIAPPITFTSTEDAAVREQMMVAIGRMLPESMWGPYEDAIRRQTSIT